MLNRNRYDTARFNGPWRPGTPAPTLGFAISARFNRTRFNQTRFNGSWAGGAPTPTPTPTGSFVGTRLVAVLLPDDDPFGIDAAATQLTSSLGYTAVLLSADDPFGVDPEQTQLTLNSIEPPPVIGDFLLIAAGGGSLLIGSGSDKVLIDG